MPSIRHPRRDPVGEIWEQNASILQRLYEVERKTLKEVKQIMERDHDFPVIPLPTYEIKLRDKLGLRKKLKRRDWHAVYQHHLSSRGKHTGVYLNGTKIPWDKAWKEIRRSGARLTSECQNSTLPAGVIVRTPSPPLIQAHVKNSTDASHTLSRPLILRQRPLSTSGSLTYHPQNRAQPSQNHSYSSASIHDPSRETRTLNFLRLAFEKNSVALEDVPWILFTEKVSSIDDSTLSAPGRNKRPSSPLLHIRFMRSPMDARTRKGALLSNIFPFSNPKSSYSVPGPNFDIYHFLAEAIYMASNKLPFRRWGNSFHFSCPDVIYILLNRIPQELLVELFQSSMSTIRAAWELLAHRAGDYGYRDAFKLLIHIGFQHSGWILPGGPAYLSFAASMGAHDIIRDLLKIGVRADDTLHACEIPAIVEATSTGSLECVKLLTEYCDVNRIILIKYTGVGEVIKHSNFSFFLSTLMNGRYVTPMRQNHGYLRASPYGERTIVRFSLEDEAQSQALSILLEGGANVDLPWETPLESTLDLSEFRSGNKNPKEWRVTTLERSYFWDKELFDKLVVYSTQAKERVIRPHIYRSAKQGTEALREYLKLADPGFDVTAFLEFVIAEIFVADIEIDAGVVRGLLEFGVNPNLPTLPLDIDYLLYCLLERRTKCNDFDNVLTLLLQSGAVIGPETLEASVEKDGIETLLILAQHGASVCQYGAMALAKAACLDNYEAVSWLLQAGVDINATVEISHRWWSVITIAAAGFVLKPEARWKKKYSLKIPAASCEMLRYLVDRGAVLKSSPNDANSFEFLHRILLHGRGNRLRERVKLFLGKLDHRNILDDKGCVFEACFNEVLDGLDEKLAVFKLLVEHGIPIRSGSVLPSLIMLEDSPELIQDLIEAGIGINTYSGCIGKQGDCGRKCTALQAAAFGGDKALVEQLLRKGANINQRAHWKGGMTALQAACEWEAQSTAEKVRRIEIIQYLLERGADIDAPPSINGGRTALQTAAVKGDMEVALLLVQAGANPNAAPAKDTRLCALDLAAERGRLDMVQFLLNIGGLSYCRGESGYDGAIKIAEEEGHFTVVDLIRQHAENDTKLFGVNLAMTFQEPGEANADGWDSPSFYSDSDSD